MDRDRTHKDLNFIRCASDGSICRSRQDDRGAQEGRVTLGVARARLCWRVHSAKGLRSARAPLTRIETRPTVDQKRIRPREIIMDHIYRLQRVSESRGIEAGVAQKSSAFGASTR